VRVHGDTLPPPEPNYWVAEPCAENYGQKVATAQPKAYGKHQSRAMCALLPKQLRGAYGATPSGLTGKAATVATVDAYAAPTMIEGASAYSTKYGERPSAKAQCQEAMPATFDNTDACGAAGW